MKKQDLLIIILLFGLWMAWPVIDRQVVKKFFPAREVPAAAEIPAPGAAEGLTLPRETALAEPAATPEQPKPADPVAVEASVPRKPEEIVVLSNDKMEVVISSHGGAVKSALLKGYRRTAAPDSLPVELDFSARKLLAWEGLEGLGERADFTLEPAADGRSVRIQGHSASGLALVRTLALDDDYLLKVSDVLSHSASEDWVISAAGLQLGPMSNLPGEAVEKGVTPMGVDTLSPGGDGVQYWSKGFDKWFKQVQEEQQLPRIPVVVDWPLSRPVDWAAVKNRYFAQILTPEGGGDRCVVQVRRAVDPRELKDPSFKPKMTGAEEVSASILLAELTIPAGGSVTRNAQCYVGPKKYSELTRYGLHQVDVMEFGFWRPVGKVLLVIMNWIHDYIWPHNYGLAIMLLTIIIRVVFWPVTHKSTESMKKMQSIQPLVAEMRAKYKDDPKRQQQEMMALYKEHKVNPLGGCLPMLIQIPVFIALFVVLRSAIELRFSSFLWIKDLSAPENLFAGMLPFGLSLNILPILMAATMAWQQKLTPTGGDPQQQKMMMFMPVIMLVFFYGFASGLSLYWTTNQCLMIVQLLWQKKSKKQEGVKK